MACEEQELLFASIVTQKPHFLSRNIPTDRIKEKEKASLYSAFAIK